MPLYIISRLLYTGKCNFFYKSTFLHLHAVSCNIAAGAGSLDIKRGTKVPSWICHPRPFGEGRFCIGVRQFCSKCMSESLISQCDDQECWKLAADSHFVFVSGRTECTWLHLRLQKQLWSTNYKQISRRKLDMFQIPSGNFQDLASFADTPLMN